jgi:serine/threonine protein kinase
MNSPEPELFETNAEKPAYREPAYEALWEEFRRRWFLNMSMNFRKGGCREKFFVTFAEKPNLWRRITVSVNYENAPLDSLEDQLNKLETQGDKSFRIFRAIHESLSQIYYFDTVTNLRIETTAHDMQLHVHVREDTNEVVEFPSTSMFRHISCPRLCEASLNFDSHLAGFVYKVKSRDRFLIKKEIPGPDAIEEFLYEVNALDALRGSDNVIRMEGLVTDDRGERVKGLLLSYAVQGSLLDILWEHSKRKPQIPWQRREKWAKQIVHGLSEIHEAGFVQGDFTLSNIVIDHTDTARIIDINRRGCPIGWEPPEFEELLSSGQRLNMAIGVKTDLFQLGMVLWSLAEHTDEPENASRPLRDPMDAPVYFRDLIKTCLSLRPQHRKSADILVERFPEDVGADPASFADESSQQIAHLEATPSLEETELDACPRPNKVYIDPQMAVTLDDCKPNWRSEAPLLKLNVPKPSAALAPSANTSARRVREKDVEYLTSANRQSVPTSTSYNVGDHSELSLCSPSRDRSSRPRRPSSATSALLSGNGGDDDYFEEYDHEIDDNNSDASSIRYAIMKRKQRLGAQESSLENPAPSTSNTKPRHRPVRFADIPHPASHDTHAIRPLDRAYTSEYGPAPDIDDPEQMAEYEAWLWEKHHESQRRLQQRLLQQQQEDQTGEVQQHAKHLHHVDSGFDETMIEALECRDDDDDAVEERSGRVLSGSSQSTEKGGSEGLVEKSPLASQKGIEVERKGGRLRVR